MDDGLEVLEIEVSISQGVQPKQYHSLFRGGTLKVRLPKWTTVEDAFKRRAELEALLGKAVQDSLEEGLRQYGKTLKEVC